MKAIKQVLGGNLQQYTMALALVLLAVVFDVVSGGRMLTSSNFQNLISGNAYVLILAIGMVVILYVSARHIAFDPAQWAALAGATVILAGLCAWIINWE